MKKLLVLIACTCWSLSSMAQATTDSTPKFHFGVKLSPCLSWFRSDKNTANNTPESDGSLLRASYGFVADIRFSKNYFFSTGVNVNYQGGKLKRTLSDQFGNPDTNRTSTWEQDLRLRYIELPLTLRMQTNEIGYIKYYFQAGIAPSINIRARYDASETISLPDYPGVNNTENEYSEEDVSDDINLFNIGMLVGGGISYNLSGTTDMLIGLTFHNGFLDITDKKAENPVLKNSKLTSNLLTLDVGILF
ncbi:MAG: porin family protein [Bacteroidota bacterium]